MLMPSVANASMRSIRKFLQSGGVSSAFKPWTPFLALIRFGLALSTFTTLVTTPSPYLFRPVRGIGDAPTCNPGIRSLGAFCIGDHSWLPWIQVACIAVLLLVMSGMLPQVTCLLHCWVAFSVASGIATPDGGDQAAVFLTFLLIPWCVTDPRLNQWRPPKKAHLGRNRVAIAVAAIITIKVQVCIIYFQSASGKVGEDSWQDGSALFYIGSGMFGPSGMLRVLYDGLFSVSAVSLAMTWSVILLEFLLGLYLLLSKSTRSWVALLGLLMHLGIALFLGIVSFQIVMIGALALLATPLSSSVYSERCRGGRSAVRSLMGTFTPWASDDTRRSDNAET